MKKTWEIFKNAVTVLIAMTAVAVMIFTIVSARTFNRSDKTIFGYKAFIVLSDSMKATDFEAGDLVLVKETDPYSLIPGDIIAFTSQNDNNYGEIVTHKIREITTDTNGEPGFITYGTTTGTDDETIVTFPYIIGKYEKRIKGVGKFFNFLKTTPGYICCILVPFLILIMLEGINVIKNFREYKASQEDELKEERRKLEEEREETRAMLEELRAMKAEAEKAKEEA